jgi:hypothetical protein
MPMSLARKIARDRRDAAVHEAGHLVMARKIQQQEGISRPVVYACIFRVEGTTPRGRTWNGDFKYFPFEPPPKRAMVGVAGVIAVATWQRRWRPRCVQSINWETPDTMSTSDWEICGCEPGKPTPELREAVTAVSALLESDTDRLWWTLCVEAHRLIKHREIRYP